jgi:lipopolysaccharide transport system permease protein
MNEELTKVTIKPGNQPFFLLLKEFWLCREALMMLTWRQIILRYKQTVFGVLWVLIQPLLAMLLFSLIFGRYAKLPTDNIPYPIFVYSALIFWNLFSEGVIRAANSFVGNENLITKIYFSRIIVPIAATISVLLDFMISFLLLIVMMIYYGHYSGSHIIYIIPAILIALGSSLGLGLFVAALNVRYRDFKYALPFIFQLWFYASPIVYSTTLIPSQSRLFYHLNPTTGMIELARYAIVGAGKISFPGVVLSFCAMILFVIVGLFVFRATERTFADYI